MAVEAHDLAAAGPVVGALRRMLDASAEAADDGQAGGDQTRERLLDLKNSGPV